MTILYRLSNKVLEPTHVPTTVSNSYIELQAQYYSLRKKLEPLQIDCSDLDALMYELLPPYKSENNNQSVQVRVPNEFFDEKTKNIALSTTPTEHPTSLVPNISSSTSTDFKIAPVLKFRSKANKKVLFKQIDDVLAQRNAAKSNNNDNTTKKSYSQIVQQHEPNIISTSLVNKIPLYSRKYQSRRDRKRLKYKQSKLATTGRINKSTILLRHNDTKNVNENDRSSSRITSTIMSSPTSILKDGKNDASDWNLVENKKKSVDSLPRTQLNPKPRNSIITPPKHRYSITLGLVPPAEIENPIVITPRLISRVIASLQYVCNNTQLMPIDDEQPPLFDTLKIFAMEDTEIEKYVFVHDVNSDSYRCSFQLASDCTINEFKLNRHLLAWLKQERINIDKTYLLGQPSVRIGFLVHASTRGDMIELLDKRIRSNMKTELRYQFDVHSSWIRSNNNLSVKVIMFRAPKIISREITQSLHKRYNSGKSIKFYPWEEFTDLSDQQSEKIVKNQTTFQNDFRTITYDGFIDFNNSLTLMDPAVTPTESQKRKLIQEPMPDVIMTEHPNSPPKQDITQMSVLKTIKTQFINSTGQQLFQEVHAPFMGTIECTVHRSKFQQARKISNNMFLSSLSVLIPKERHSLVFADPTNIIPSDLIPSTLLKNNISEWMTKNKEHVTSMDQNYQPSTKQRNSRKLLVFQNYSQAVSLIPTSSNSPVPDKPKVTFRDTPPPVVKESSDTTNKSIQVMMESLNKKVDNRFLSIEKRQQEDRVAIATLNEQVRTINTTFRNTLDSVTKLEDHMTSTIKSSISDSMREFALTFEQQLNQKLQASAVILEEKNEQRANHFLQEHRNFVAESEKVQLEQRKINSELQAMIRQLIINNSTNEVTFSKVQEDPQASENQNDVSFELYNE
jgi:hypothetical protein